MHVSVRLLLAVVLVMATVAQGPAAMAAQPAARTEQVQLVVKARPAAAATALEAVSDRLALKGARTLPGSQLTTVTVPAVHVEEALERLNADPRVEYAERDVWLQAAAPSADPLSSQQWGLRHTGVDTLWETTRGSASVVIAVVDSGLDPSHPDFAGARFVAGRNFVAGGDPTNTFDDHSEGHGTSVAGVIVAQHNGIGTAGVCPECAIMPLKALDQEGLGSQAGVAAAVEYAVHNGARIINLSLSGTSPGTTRALADAVAAAADAGVLVLAAAGNSGDPAVHYPAGFPGVLGVGASQPDDGRYWWSNYGDWVHLAAPGCNDAPRKGGTYSSFCGTSSAAPFVAGVAGLLASTSPAPDAATLSRVLQGAAVPVPYVTEGRVDGPAAQTALRDAVAPQVTVTAPTGGVVHRSIKVAADATDNARVKRVEFFVDGRRAATADTAPYQAILDTTELGEGPRVIHATATDTAGLATTSAPVTITVDNTSPLAVADLACPQAAAHSFSDVSSANVHSRAIGCALHLGVAGGVSELSYRPAASVSRAQMATFIANAIAAAGVHLPASPDAFTDDDGSLHQDAINRLAAAGVVQGVRMGRYEPDVPVTREQMATFLVRAYEHIAGQPLTAEQDAFSDDDGRTHEGSINKAAAAGLASGIASRRFAPRDDVRRDQMASFIIRVLDLSVARGLS